MKGHLDQRFCEDGGVESRHRALDRAFRLSSSSKFRLHRWTICALGTDSPPTTQSLLDEIINSINFLAERALASVETGLLNAPPAQLGFGRPPAETNANSKSKRKRKQQLPPPPEDDAPEHPLSLEEVEAQAHAEIAGGTHQLETLLCTSIDRNFDRFELYVMRNILCVRPEDRDWIRLGHYEGLSFDDLPPSVLGGRGSDDDDGNDGGAGGKKAREPDAMDIDPAEDHPDRPTVPSVNRLRRRLQASQKLNTMLVAEKARNDALLGELRSIVGRATSSGKGSKAPPAAAATAVKTEEGDAAADAKPPLSFLHDRGDLTQADAATPLTTTTAFSLSQLQALRALSTSLSSLLPDLRAAPADAASGGDGESAAAAGKTWRKERVEYVESAARRHLEGVRGLELGRNGEVRDGEWQGEGGRLGGGEVGALEGVVEMLGEQAGSGGEGRGEGGGGGDAGDGEDEEMGDGEGQ